VTHRMADYSQAYDPERDFDRHYTYATARRVRHWLRPGDRVLELGSATGLMTELLAERGVHVTAVERSPSYLERARARGLADVEFVEASVEEYEPDERFHHVIASHLINELPDPRGLLVRCRSLLAPGGLVHITHINPRSLHRLVALEMGMISELGERSARGEVLNTQEVFDAERLIAMAREAGLVCAHREGVLVKPLTNEQMAELPEDVVQGFDLIARHFPDNAALNYLIFVDESVV
jgi:2-polyprenyl-3-methyl-5-hydroxy-6-metoxy-1,4-benzoquinol methylase